MASGRPQNRAVIPYPKRHPVTLPGPNPSPDLLNQLEFSNGAPH